MSRKHQKLDQPHHRNMAVTDWVKQAVYDAMRLWIEDHEEELNQCIVDAISERIEISYTPKLTVKPGKEGPEPPQHVLD